jgi:hypothetical protein
MTEEKSKWWAAITGLASSTTLLMLLTMAVTLFLGGSYNLHETPCRWSETVMRLIFDAPR